MYQNHFSKFKRIRFEKKISLRDPQCHYASLQEIGTSDLQSLASKNN